MRRCFPAIVLGILSVFALVLWMMGRIPWCACGIHMWTWSAWSSETSQNFGDPYSFSHILHGIIFFWILTAIARRAPLEWKFIGAMLIEIGWEILENSPLIINRYRATTASLDYYGDSILNSLGDIAFCMLGFWLAWRMPWKWTLATLVGIELIMLVTIRDNLTLNILMLLTPVSAIRDWQMVQ